MFASKAKSRRMPSLAQSAAAPGAGSANSSAQPGGKGGAGAGEDAASTLPPQVTQVMNVIDDYWEYMTVNEFNPVPHALALLDTSSLGKDVKAFMAIYDKVQAVMDIIVNDYHHAFQINIQTFSSVVDNITDSQAKVRTIQTNLTSAKEYVSCKRNDLLHLWIKSIQLKEMTRILDTVDEIQRTPEKLEVLIAGKYFLTAVRTLQHADRTLRSHDFKDIGALENVRQRLKELNVSLYEMILDELHSHLYLNSPHAIASAPSGMGGEQEAGRPRSSDDTSRLDPKEIQPPLTEDLSVNPELDTRKYMHTLMEAMYLLGRLGEAMTTIWERMSIELYYGVERCIQEVSSKYPIVDTRQDQINVLVQLLRSVNAKFEAVIHAHLFILNLVQDMARTRDNVPTPIYSIADMWSLMFNELKVFLSDYLFTASQATKLGSAPLTEVLQRKREPLATSILNSSARYYRIGGASFADSIRKLYRELDPRTKELVTLQYQQSEQTQSSVGIVDKYASVSSAGHRLLVQADPYNILVMYGTICEFARRVEKAISVGSTLLRNFLDDFILHSFLPQMEGRVGEYYTTYVHGTDAYQTEYALNLSQLPLTKSAVALMLMVRGMCKTLFALPVHQEQVVLMMERLLVRYQEQCYAHYKRLLASNPGCGEEETDQTAICGAWAADPELKLLLAQHYATFHEFRHETTSTLSREETRVEMGLKRDRSFHRSELIFAPKRVEGLANLHYAMEWFGSQVSQLVSRAAGVGADAPATRRPMQRAPKPLLEQVVAESQELSELLKVSMESLPQLPAQMEEDFYLSLPQEMESRFRGLFDQFRTLSHACLFTLRIEARCHCMYFLDLALREGNYYLEGEVCEPDPYVAALNTDLLTMEEVFEASLATDKITFVFHGLCHLVSHLLRSNLRQIRAINAGGVAKLLRNVASLQQCLTSITKYQDTGLDQVYYYLDILRSKGKVGVGHARPSLHVFMLTPILHTYTPAQPCGMPNGEQTFLDACSKYRGAFTYEEAKVALDLLYARELNSPADQQREYQEVLKGVKEFFVKHRG